MIVTKLADDCGGESELMIEFLIPRGVHKITDQWQDASYARLRVILSAKKPGGHI